jgi:hypothetical protein
MSEENRLQKNSVFGQPDNNVPSVSREELARQEFDLEIPTLEAPLPSRGLLYPSGHPLHGQDRVEIRAMTAKEEDLLSSRSLIKNGTVINELIKSCLVDKTIKVDSLISGDRNAIMMAIRSSGYGEDYDTSHTCPNCNTKNGIHVNLNELSIKPLEIEPTIPGENRFRFILPLTKKEVHFRFLTGLEEEDLIKTSEARKKKGLLADNLITGKLNKTLVSVDGKEDRGYVTKFISFMPAKDSAALRKYIDDNEPGVDLTIPFACSNCDYADDIMMPLGANFFWPNANV